LLIAKEDINQVNASLEVTLLMYLVAPYMGAIHLNSIFNQFLSLQNLPITRAKI